MAWPVLRTVLEALVLQPSATGKVDVLMWQVGMFTRTWQFGSWGRKARDEHKMDLLHEAEAEHTRSSTSIPSTLYSPVPWSPSFTIPRWESGGNFMRRFGMNSRK